MEHVRTVRHVEECVEQAIAVMGRERAVGELQVLDAAESIGLRHAVVDRPEDLQLAAMLVDRMGGEREIVDRRVGPIPASIALMPPPALKLSLPPPPCITSLSTSPVNVSSAPSPVA